MVVREVYSVEDTGEGQADGREWRTGWDWFEGNGGLRWSDGESNAGCTTDGKGVCLTGLLRRCVDW